MHTQPMFRDAESVGGAVAERLYATGLCLPSSSSLAPESQQRVVRAVAAALVPHAARAAGA
jgi:pyridoxal phosphate-dependent aminotransferase EpsN